MNILQEAQHITGKENANSIKSLINDLCDEHKTLITDESIEEVKRLIDLLPEEHNRCKERKQCMIIVKMIEREWSRAREFGYRTLNEFYDSEYAI
jgi:hypothetical protein